MTPAQLNTLINLKAGTNDTTFTQADKLVYINLFKDEMASLILEKNAGYFLLPTTFNLVADQREYSFADTLLNRIHKLELKFSSTDARQPSKGIKDYLGSETESEIVKFYSNSPGQFRHYIRRRSLFILSGTITSVTDGGRLWSYAFPADLANLTEATVKIETDPSTTTFGLPRLFQELLARRVVMEWKSNQPKPISLSPLEMNYKEDFKNQLDSLSTIDNSLEIIGEMPAPGDLGNSGWDY